MKKDPKLGCGPRIKKWRKGIPMKSYELAKLINISQGSLSDIENNNSNPSAVTIVKFYLCTDINLAWMLTGKSGDIDQGQTVKAPLTINLNSTVKEVLIRRED